MTLTPVPACPAPKRPRLTRSVSGPAPVNAAPAQITLPLNQLGGLPLGKVLTVAGSPAGTGLGGYTLLTSPLGGSELAADASNLTVLSAVVGQEGAAGGGAAAFVKVVGPQIQLVTLPSPLQGLGARQGAVTQTVSGISVVDAVVDAMATADDTQEEGRVELEGEGHLEQVHEADEEQHSG